MVLLLCRYTVLCLACTPHLEWSLCVVWSASSWKSSVLDIKNACTPVMTFSEFLLLQHFHIL